jgi:hypothetical protein
MFNDIITVYNKYKGTDGLEKWQRIVVRGVYWNAIKGAVMRKTGVTTADSVQLIIPYSVPVSKFYRSPKEWLQMDDKTGYWTLQPGDTIIKGCIEYNVVKSTKELQEYDDVLTITSVDFKVFGGDMKHWEVSGK